MLNKCYVRTTYYIWMTLQLCIGIAMYFILAWHVLVHLWRTSARMLLLGMCPVALVIWHGLDFSASRWCIRKVGDGCRDHTSTWLRLCLSLFLTFLLVCFDLICCYLIFNKQEDQGCPSKINRIWTKQIVVYQSWFVLHCGFKRKLYFIMCFAWWCKLFSQMSLIPSCLETILKKEFSS